MNDTLLPPPDRDTEPPSQLDGLHRSTLPPFASDARVTRLEEQHREVMAALDEIRELLQKTLNAALDTHSRQSKLEERFKELEARVTILERGRPNADA